MVTRESTTLNFPPVTWQILPIKFHEERKYSQHLANYFTWTAKVFPFNSCALCCKSFWIIITLHLLVMSQLWSCMWRKIFTAVNIPDKIFRSSAFVFGRKSHLLEIKRLFILVTKYLVEELSSESTCQPPMVNSGISVNNTVSSCKQALNNNKREKHTLPFTGLKSCHWCSHKSD